MCMALICAINPLNPNGISDLFFVFFCIGLHYYGYRNSQNIGLRVYFPLINLK